MSAPDNELFLMSAPVRDPFLTSAPVISDLALAELPNATAVAITPSASPMASLRPWMLFLPFMKILSR